MHIAVASRDGKSIAGHIGKCADWIVFEVTEGDSPDTDYIVSEVERIKLPKELVFHHYKDDGPHPLKSCKAVIGASAGESFVNKMKRRGIDAVLTAEPNPAQAVVDYVRDNVTPPRPRPIGGLICKIRDAFHAD
jgi:predicted Fe-Mo cluster-binding NifX family protein